MRRKNQLIVFPSNSHSHMLKAKTFGQFWKLDFVLSFGILGEDHHQTLRTIKYLFSKSNQKSKDPENAETDSRLDIKTSEL